MKAFGKRFLSVLTALGLALPAFSGLTVSADSPTPRLHYGFDNADLQTIENDVAGDYTAHGFGSIESSDHAVKGRSLYLKGGYVKLPDNCLADLESMSISFWVDASGETNNAHVFDIGNSPATFLNLSGYRGQKEYAADLRIGGDAEEITSGDKNTFRTSLWSHLVVSYTDKTLSVYKDGVRVQTKSNLKHNISELGTVTNALLGLSLWSADASFFGYIDEFKIFDAALTDAEVQAEYQSGVDALGESLKAGLADAVAAQNGIESFGGLTENLTLPAELDHSGFGIAWATSDEKVITKSGVIAKADTARTATLTATLTRGGSTVTVELPVTVAAANTPLKADAVPDITTTAGTPPTLPATVSANGGTAKVGVTWEKPDAGVYTFGGTVSVTGTTAAGEAVAVRVLVDGEAFSNPIINQLAADPYIVYQDGYYYFCRSSDQGAGVMVAKSKRLQDIGSMPRVKVYSAPSGTMYSRDYWAPELHYLRDENGDYNWYIYVAADDGNNANHRMYVLRCTDPENAQAPYEMVGKLTPTDPSQDKWAIDGTVVTTKQGYYFVWSGWPGDRDEIQNLYIAKMSNPTTLGSPRTLISTPDTVWDRKGYGNDFNTGAVTGTPLVNEGPQQIVNPADDSKVYVTYSCNGSWTDWYSLGYVVADADADLLDANSWTKSDGPFLTQSLDKADTTYGTGHATIVPSPDQSEQWIVYHAFQRQGGGWENRSARAMPIRWSNGAPVMDAPVADSVVLDQPSGTESVVFGRYEAENATLTKAAKATDACASGGYYVTVNKTSEIRFTVTAPQTGLYQISFTGCHTTGGEGYQTLTVNEVPRQIRYMGSNVTASHYSTAYDPTAAQIGTGIYANLYAGENTITLTYDSAAGGATRVDCMTLLRVGDAEPVAVESVRADETLELKTGSTGSVHASVYPPRADNPTLTYDSSEKEVATVDANGVVTALKAGTTTITATSAEKPTATAKTVVTVVDPIPVASIAVPPEATLKRGETFTLVATVAPDNADDKTLAYASSDDTVATVDENGVVTALKAGTATITVTSVYTPAVQAKTVITVVDPISVTSVSAPRELNLKVGAKRALGATAAPANADDRTLRYVSSAPSVVTVDANGVLTGVKAGKATVTVSSVANPAAKAVCTVIVSGTAASIIDGKVYANGAPVKSKLIKIGGKRVYVNAAGALTKSKLQKVGKTTYAFDKSGYQITGTKITRLNKKYYYVKNGKVVTKKKWFKVKGSWVHVGKKGALTTNKLIKHKGKLAYVNKKGRKVKKGKIKIGKKRYVIQNYVARRKK